MKLILLRLKLSKLNTNLERTPLNGGKVLVRRIFGKVSFIAKRYYPRRQSGLLEMARTLISGRIGGVARVL